MIEMYRIITNKQDSDVTIKFNIIPAAITRGNINKLRQDHVRYDLRKFSFSNRVRTLWNSLSDTVVKASSVKSFKGDWIDSGMIRKSSIIGKLTSKAPEAEVM